MLRVNFIVRNERGLLFTPLVFLILFTLSCEKGEIDFSDENREEVAATFNTTINALTTRASGTIWEAGDEIGIFAVTSGSTLSDPSIYNNYKNIKYKNNTDGSVADFQPIAEEIKFPGTKEMLDFIAYYPYSATGIIGGTSPEGEWGTGTGSDFDLSIDVSHQSPQSAIDVMYASTTGHNRDNPDVGLSFSHSLSQLAITITAEDRVALEGATINILNAVTQGSMKLNDGTVTPSAEVSGDTIATVAAYDSSEDKINATAIMIPGWDLSTAQIHIQTADDNNYIWQPGEYQLIPNTRISYSLKLSPNTVKMITNGTTIDSWLEESNDIIEVLLPDNSIIEDSFPDGATHTGNGTIENPYSVAQFIDSQDETEVWVQGFIMGTAKNEGSLKFSLHTDISDNDLSDTNLVLADNPNDTDTTRMVPIQFVIGSEEQDQLNLKDNNSLIGKEIKLRCTIDKPGGIKSGVNLSGFILM